MKPVSAALNNLECKIEKLRLERVGLTDSGAEDLASALRTNPSLMELYLGNNKLGDTGVKLMSVGSRNPECKNTETAAGESRSHRIWCRGSRLRSQYKPITDGAATE
ncbi:ribonuclease inhibitor [Hemitrygon akajei]|uniref:ribonuclease inhibitor n=1 Tax=Hemitrygon akajei TaxID=2704970 RepID=UPI003BF96457